MIGNAIDGARLNSLAAEPVPRELPSDYFIGMGRLVPNKNFSMMLQAYAKVPKAPPLVILGEGPEEAALSAQANELGILERLHLLGFVDNPYPIIKSARALVSSSLAEGFPNALAEAMALGCPVIATDCRSGPPTF